MKLLRWAVAGASVYAVYKYSIGKKAKGEEVLLSPERAIENLTQDEDTQESESPEPPKPRKPRATKRPSK